MKCLSACTVFPPTMRSTPTIFVSITYAFISAPCSEISDRGSVSSSADCCFINSKDGSCCHHFHGRHLLHLLWIYVRKLFRIRDEDPIWLSPKTHMSTLPFLGTLNTVFIVAIGFGMFLILLSMVFHIINAVKAKDTENIWFDHNAVAGLIFYGALTATIFLFMSGHSLPAAAVLVVMFVIPLLLIFFKEPLTNLVNKKSEIMPGSKGMFFVQGFFEMFEVLLSYFSNTLSFVRIGAFAVSHAAMMEVVLTLAGVQASGNPNWIVIVLGNLFVCGLEGLIVGIQVLRLEYYELFSRFYKGNGREFKPFIKKTEN